MPKITYLLGAGASVGVLPLVKERFQEEEVATEENPKHFVKILKRYDSLSEELNNFSTVVNTYTDFTGLANLNGNKDRYNQLHNFIISVEALGRESSSFLTIDTYFKYLFYKDKLWFYEKKLIFEQYLVFKQLVYNLDCIANPFPLTYGGHKDYSTYEERFEYSSERESDKRYMSFITTIYDDFSDKFPSNINVLTWNYDIQMELALMDYIEPHTKIFPINKIKSSAVSQNSSLSSLLPIHLNGLCRYRPDKNEKKSDISGIYGLDSFESYLESSRAFLKFSFKKGVYKDSSDIRFAFEENEISKNENYQKAIEAAKGTNILVVIGYSFPIFNNGIDRGLLESMEHSLEKIYFQDPYLDGKFLPDTFKMSDKFKKEISERIIHIKNTREFFIPREMGLFRSREHEIGDNFKDIFS